MRVCFSLKGDITVDSGGADIGGMVTAGDGLVVSSGSLELVMGDEVITTGDLTLTAG